MTQELEIHALGYHCPVEVGPETYSDGFEAGEDKLHMQSAQSWQFGEEQSVGCLARQE